MSAYDIPSDYMPQSDEDVARWDVQSLRYRMLTGQQRDDVIEEIRGMFAAEISMELEVNPDLSRNTFRMVWQQLCNAYLDAPMVTLKDGQSPDMSSIITHRLWPQRQTADFWTQAIRESLFRLDWVPGGTTVRYRPVSPDLVVCRALPDQPDVPGYVSEVRLRHTAAGEEVWTKEVWDIMSPTPIFKILTMVGDVWKDVTAQFAPDLAGEYPYMDREGNPILPYELIHAEIAPQLWSYHTGAELVAGSLRLAALWTHWGDGFTSASHPQRYAVDVSTQAGITRHYSGHNVEVIPTDHKSILRFKSDGPSGAVLGQYSAAMDPRTAAESLRMYEKGLAVYAGLNPSDLQLTQGQSGYAIVVSNQGNRAQQKRTEPARRMADQRILAKAAKMANAYSAVSPNLPEEPGDYRIEYSNVGTSAEERKTHTEVIKAELEMGLISRVEAYRRLNPGVDTDEEAVRRLIDIDRMTKILNRSKQAPQTATPATQGDENERRNERGDSELVGDGTELPAERGIGEEEESGGAVIEDS